MGKRNKEIMRGFKGASMAIKYMTNYAQMRNPDDLCFLGTDWCIVAKKEMVLTTGYHYLFVLWLKASSTNHSGFIFVQDEYDRAKVGRKLGPFGIVYNTKKDICKFTWDVTPDGAINEIVREAKRCYTRLLLFIPAILLILGFYFYLLFRN